MRHSAASLKTTRAGSNLYRWALSKRLIILGKRIHDIPSFYDEVNPVFMKNETWSHGHSLDAFNDMLYGQYGNTSVEGSV